MDVDKAAIQAAATAVGENLPQIPVVSPLNVTYPVAQQITQYGQYKYNCFLNTFLINVVYTMYC